MLTTGQLLAAARKIQALTEGAIREVKQAGSEAEALNKAFRALEIIAQELERMQD